MIIKSRSISLYCPICGNDQFSCAEKGIEDLSTAPDSLTLKCSDCGSTFTKAELIENNQDTIIENIEDIKQEALNEFKKKLQKIFN